MPVTLNATQLSSKEFGSLEIRDLTPSSARRPATGPKRKSRS